MGESHRQSHSANSVDQAGDRNNRYVRAANGRYDGSRRLDQQDVTPTQVKTPARTKVLPVESETDFNPSINSLRSLINMTAVTGDSPVHIQKGLGKAVGIMVLRYVAPGFIAAILLQKIVFLPQAMAGVAGWLNFNVIPG